MKTFLIETRDGRRLRMPWAGPGRPSAAQVDQFVDQMRQAPPTVPDRPVAPGWRPPQRAPMAGPVLERRPANPLLDAVAGPTPPLPAPPPPPPPMPLARRLRALDEAAAAETARRQSPAQRRTEAAREAEREAEVRYPAEQGWRFDPQTGAWVNPDRHPYESDRALGGPALGFGGRPVGTATGREPVMGRGRAGREGMDQAASGAMRAAQGVYGAAGQAVDAGMGGQMGQAIEEAVRVNFGDRPDGAGAGAVWDRETREFRQRWWFNFGQGAVSLPAVGAYAAGRLGVGAGQLVVGAERLTRGATGALVADQFGQGVGAGMLELANPAATPEERLQGAVATALTVGPELGGVALTRSWGKAAARRTDDALRVRGLQAETRPEVGAERVRTHDERFGPDAPGDPAAVYRAADRYADALMQANPALDPGLARAQAEALAVIEHQRGQARLWRGGGMFARDAPLETGRRPVFTDAGEWSDWAAERTAFASDLPAGVEPGALGTFTQADDMARLHPGGDATTVTHESFHRFRHYMTRGDMDQLAFWASGGKARRWDDLSGADLVAAEERAAVGWERFLHEGRAPNVRVRDAFGRMRTAMRAAYGAEAPGEAPPEISGLYAAQVTPGRTPAPYDPGTVAAAPRAPEPEPAPEPVPEPEPAPRVDEPEPPALADPTPARVVPTDESEIVYIDPDAIQVHPDMQHRVDVDRRTGVKAENVAGRKTFLADQAGVLTVWRRLDGALFVADGHHRLQIAKNAEVFARRGPGGELVPAPRAVPVRILEEADGWTARQAADDAFLRNAVGGTSDAVETATAMRNMGMTPASLRASEGTRLPLAIEHHVQGLLGLRGELFEEFVGNRVVDFRAAAGIGRVPGASEQAQRGALSDAARANITTEADGESLARRWAQADAARGEAGRGGLFDEADLPPFAEMTQIEGRIASSIGSDVGRTARDAKVRIREGESLDAAARRAEALALGGTGAEASRLVRRAFATDAALNAELATLASEVRDGRRSVQSAAGALDARTREAVRRGSGQDVGGAEAGAAVGGPVGPGLRPEEGQDQASTLMQGPRRPRTPDDAAAPDLPPPAADADATAAPAPAPAPDPFDAPAPASGTDPLTAAMPAARKAAEGRPSRAEFYRRLGRAASGLTRRQLRVLHAYATRYDATRETYGPGIETLAELAERRHSPTVASLKLPLGDRVVRTLFNDARAAGWARKLYEDATGLKFEGSNADLEAAINRLAVPDHLTTEVIEEGFRGADGRIAVKGLAPIEADIRAAGLKASEVEEAFRARRDIVLAERDAGGEDGITPERAAHMLRMLEEWEAGLTPTQMAAYRQARADLDAFQFRYLMLYEEYGLKPKGWARGIEAKNPHYWPLVPRRTPEELAMADLNPERAASPQPHHMYAKGGKESESGWVTMRRRTENVIRMGRANQALATPLEEMSQVPALEYVVRDITDEVLGAERRQRAAGGVPADQTSLFDLEDVEGPVDTLAAALDWRRAPPIEGQEAVVTLFKDGKRRVYRLDPHVWDAMRRGQPSAANPVVQVLRAMGNLVRTGTTGILNPVFGLAVNPMLDVSSAILIHGLNPLLLMRGARAAWSEGKSGDWYAELWRQAAAAGAFSSSGSYRDLMPVELLYDPNTWNPVLRAAQHENPDIRRVGDLALAMGRKLDKPIRTLEHMTRIARFDQVNRKLLAQGATPDEAAMRAGQAARDLINFQEVGAMGRFLSWTMGVPYAPIPQQVLMSTYRGFKRNPAAFTARCLALITVPKMIEYSIYGDDPEYRRLPDHVLDGAFVAKIDGQWYAARFPLELGAIFAGVPRRFLEMQRGRKLPEEAAHEQAVQAWRTVVPPMVPSGVALVQQLQSYLVSGTILDHRFGRIIEYPTPPEAGRTPDPAALAKAMAHTGAGTFGLNVARAAVGEPVRPLGRFSPRPGPAGYEPTGQARAWLRRTGAGWGTTRPIQVTDEATGERRTETPDELQARVVRSSGAIDAAVLHAVKSPLFRDASAPDKRTILSSVVASAKRAARRHDPADPPEVLLEDARIAAEEALDAWAEEAGR